VSISRQARHIATRNPAQSPTDSARLLAGDTLLHTDFNPLNVLVHNHTARIIDWAWPTRGAAFIDPACWLVRLIAAGHTPDSAEAWAQRCPALATASAQAITVFAQATSRVWDETERNEPVPWKQRMAQAARAWRDFRIRAT
jgi:Ser/Thr protein kinase RdoA (MazF antagonist)